MSNIPSRASRKPSGTHPAVVEYREKLQSIEDNETPSIADLNEKLSRYLEEITTPIPPPLEEAERKA